MSRPIVPAPDLAHRVEEIETRLAELEIRDAYHTRLVEDLNEVVAAQDRRILRLEREIEKICLKTVIPADE
jgi:uncharacterized coiled-coil protein SlyX